jgi:hypothetical protein
MPPAYRSAEDKITRPKAWPQVTPSDGLCTVQTEQLYLRLRAAAVGDSTAIIPHGLCRQSAPANQIQPVQRLVSEADLRRASRLAWGRGSGAGRAGR